RFTVARTPLGPGAPCGSGGTKEPQEFSAVTSMPSQLFTIVPWLKAALTDSAPIRMMAQNALCITGDESECFFIPSGDFLFTAAIPAPGPSPCLFPERSSPCRERRLAL